MNATEFEELPKEIKLAAKIVARNFVERHFGIERRPDAITAEYERFAGDIIRSKARLGGLSAAGFRLEWERFQTRIARLNALSVEAAEDAKPREFPIDALGPTLAGVTRAIIEVAQCQPSLAAATVLAHVAGAVQAIADVRTPQGVLLTSGAVLIMVKSSDGKGVAWKIAIAPCEKYEAELRKDHKKHMRRWKAATTVWLDEQDRLRKATKDFASLEEHVAALTDHEDRKPRRPNDPCAVFTGGGTADGNH